MLDIRGIWRKVASKKSYKLAPPVFPPESLSTVFGQHLKEQVEERLKFYESGDVPRKNDEVMKEALQEHNAKVKMEKKGKKRKLEEAVNGTYTLFYYTM